MNYVITIFALIILFYLLLKLFHSIVKTIVVLVLIGLLVILVIATNKPNELFGSFVSDNFKIYKVSP